MQTPGAPLLTITLNPQLSTITISWPSPSTGWTLQQNTDLGTSNWVPTSYYIVNIDGTNSVTVTPPTGNLFFRLKQ